MRLYKEMASYKKPTKRKTTKKRKVTKRKPVRKKKVVRKKKRKRGASKDTFAKTTNSSYANTSFRSKPGAGKRSAGGY